MWSAYDAPSVDTMKRPSLGTILGATALVVAVGSSGLPADAASLITGKQVKDQSLTGKDIKNGSITAANLAPGAVTSGPAGAKGDKGDIGPAGTALAYAYVNADGTLQASRTKGVGWSFKPGDTGGSYCLGGIAQPPHNVSLTLAGG